MICWDTPSCHWQTLFAGLTIESKTKIDCWLKRLLMIHGVFFISCLTFPLFGVFSAGYAGSDWIGTAVLEFWCVYFIPIDVLSYLHFRKK